MGSAWHIATAYAMENPGALSSHGSQINKIRCARVRAQMSSLQNVCMHCTRLLRLPDAAGILSMGCCVGCLASSAAVPPPLLPGRPANQSAYPPSPPHCPPPPLRRHCPAAYPPHPPHHLQFTRPLHSPHATCNVPQDAPAVLKAVQQSAVSDSRSSANNYCSTSLFNAKARLGVLQGYWRCCRDFAASGPSLMCCLHTHPLHAATVTFMAPQSQQPPHPHRSHPPRHPPHCCPPPPHHQQVPSARPAAQLVTIPSPFCAVLLYLADACACTCSRMHHYCMHYCTHFCTIALMVPECCKTNTTASPQRSVWLDIQTQTSHHRQCVVAN